MNLDFLKGWRTVTVNGLSAAVSVLEVSDITSFLSDSQMVWFLGGLAVANIILRLITTTSVGKKA